jgi:glycosyltransferase involved in cell wall biosynthesis
MKVALLTDGIMPFVVGGMQKHSHYLAAFLARQGVEVVLLHCVHTANIPEREEVLKALDLPSEAPLEVIGKRFPRMGNMPGQYLRESYAYSIELFKVLQPRLNEFDIIYAKGFTAWELLNRKRKGLVTPPVAVKFHGYEMFQYTPGIQGVFSRWLLRGPVKFCNIHADYVYAYGGKITDLITDLGVSPQRIIEVPTGIAASWCRNLPLPSSENAVRRFVFVGRYERRKGIEELHRMLAKMWRAVRRIYIDHKLTEDTRSTDRAKIPANTRPRAAVTVCWAPNLALISDMSEPLAQCKLMDPPQAPAATPHMALKTFPMQLRYRSVHTFSRC